MSTVNALAGVVAAEESTANDRSAAIALIAVAYGLGSGLVAVGRGLLPGDPSFRVVTAVALVPLLLLPLLARRMREPAIARTAVRARALPGAVPRPYRRRVVVLGVLTGTIAIATGPGFTYLFLYGERVLERHPTAALGAGGRGRTGRPGGHPARPRRRRPDRSAGDRRAAMAATGAAVAFGYAGTRWGWRSAISARSLRAARSLHPQGRSPPSWCRRACARPWPAG
jgi:hypothetical protein